jgi:hypothetical protein
VAAENAQTVVAVRNRYTQSLTFWNPARTAKPQTFTAARSAALEDPTVGRGCDFCSWRELTAADAFGRCENEHAVTASNLFKFTAHHGLVLFKHHEPLAFSEPQLGGLLSAAQGWAHAAHAAHPDTARHPTLLWNALPRSGASQFHGHAQVVMTAAPLPEAVAAAAAAAAYDADVLSAGAYAADVAAAHGALGLRRTLRVAAPAGDDGSSGSGSSLATCFASVAPYKDCECVVHGASVTSPAFVRLLHVVMRALLDRCGVVTFNATVTGLSLAPPLPPRGAAAHAPASSEALLQAAAEDEEAALFGSGGVTARVVSRGHAASRASDFGALEVFGGASIGHTSPWTVAAAMDAELAARSLEWAPQRGA